MNDTERLAAARAALASLRPAVEAREPWPLAERFGTEPEAAWGPREVLAHVAEMLPYWLGELERVLAGGPEPVPFGRVADDPLRVGVIERDRTLPLGVLFTRIDAGLGAWLARLTTLTEAERERRALHERLGELPAGAILERFVLHHADEHIAQLEALLGPERGARTAQP